MSPLDSPWVVMGEAYMLHVGALNPLYLNALFTELFKLNCDMFLQVLPIRVLLLGLYRSMHLAVRNEHVGAENKKERQSPTRHQQYSHNTESANQ